MRKIIKNSNTEQVNTFRLHYFPNIPVPDSCNDRTSGNSEAAAPAGNRRVSQGMPSVASNHERQQHQAEIERQTHEQGFAKGEQEGRMAAQRQFAPLTAALESTLVELDGIRKKIRQHMEQEVVELALHVARKVVRHELTVSKDAIVCVVKEAMNKLDDPGKISIRLNPDDLKRIHGASDQLKSVMENLDSIQFEEDAGINCGGCYIQTEYGEIDARIEEQLRTIEEAFRSEMRNSTDQT